MRTMAVVGWVAIFAALFSWQAIGLLHCPAWPTMSDMLRTLTRTALGRSLLFGVWLWIGWHVFVRGWEPLPGP